MSDSKSSPQDNSDLIKKVGMVAAGLTAVAIGFFVWRRRGSQEIQAEEEKQEQVEEHALKRQFSRKLTVLENSFFIDPALDDAEQQRLVVEWMNDHVKALLG